ncbi:HAMP domain-containing histidine kinase [Virgibacillus sp. MSP4-1]|uniref:sensor histidine kinase n=1 Tax=Virgibacillus sp. MSP4-1 TaxID=2700081 RepID=UPI00039AF18D|nr:HAMP domain-containing sensor histidine kinase [Virgibacillus sp. MSP4-1]QHS24203.1 HAMP domain-containing histidine kinase [Virgibacillus sp. MSP4-1]
MRLTLRSKIFIYLLIVSLSGILLTSFSVLWGFENQFNQYLQTNRTESSSLIKQEIVQSYEESGKLMNNRLNNLLHQQAMTEDLFYKIYNEEGKLIADTTMMLGMMGNMGMNFDVNKATEYEKVSYNLATDTTDIGRMEVYYPEELIGEEVAFLETIKSNIYLAVIVTVLLALLFSLLFSKHLTSGLQKLSKAIQKLQAHKWRTRVDVNELTSEMQPLGESFNQLAESLSKEEKLRKQFTADFAHEIRTPIATLRSQMEAYLDGIFEPTDKRLKQSHDELMRLVRLVNELEDLLAAENPQMKLNKTDIEVRKLLHSLEEQFKPAFQDKGVQLTVQKPDREYWFKADHDRVVQILTNIVNNALQYTPAGKKVLVKTEDTNDDVGFLVKDEGIGIATEDIPYLFERFYRGDKSRDRKTGGIGIGLSIVKALVEAHQGKIEIDSKVNAGTEVKVFFPKR